MRQRREYLSDVRRLIGEDLQDIGRNAGHLRGSVVGLIELVLNRDQRDFRIEQLQNRKMWERNRAIDAELEAAGANIQHNDRS